MEVFLAKMCKMKVFSYYRRVSTNWCRCSKLFSLHTSHPFYFFSFIKCFFKESVLTFKIENVGKTSMLTFLKKHDQNDKSKPKLSSYMTNDLLTYMLTTFPCKKSKEGWNCGFKPTILNNKKLKPLKKFKTFRYMLQEPKKKKLTDT